MKNYITYKTIGVAILFFAVPFVINFLSCINAPFVSWTEPSKWTVFWGQYISGFASFAMLYVAWRTLHTTKEANRPYVVVDIIERRSVAYIRCRNIGHTTAQNIKIQIDFSYLSGLKIPEVKGSFESIVSAPPFVLEPNGKRIWEIFCIPSSHLDYLNNYRTEIELTYDFKGKRITKSSWIQNEEIFKSNVIKCDVSYDNYKNTYSLEYNNRLLDYEPAELISDSISGVAINLSNLVWPLGKIKEKYCGNDKNK